MNDSVTSQNHDSDEELNTETLPLSLLFKFIRPFNGNRNELNTFIQNCNSAFQLAQPNQTDKLFFYVAAQLSSNVVNEIDLPEITNWTQLKNKLKSFYSQFRDLTQLHEELETIKQNYNESVTDFFKRLEKLKNECICAEQNQCENPNDISSLKRAIQRTALRRFILHCKSEISQMLRARDINTLNEAFSIALQEEKVLAYTRPAPKHKSTHYCTICKMNNHSTQNCRKKRINHNPNNFNNPNTSNSNSYDSNKYCNYCKNKGHVISECRKLKFKNQNQNQNYASQNPRVNHLNLNQSPELNALPADTQIQEAFNSA